MPVLKPLTPHYQDSHRYRLRLDFLVGFLLALSFILILRLGYLQIAEYKKYATLSLRNQMSIIPIDPPRGIILDRNGIILADNKPVYTLEIIPERVKNLPELLTALKLLIPSIREEEIEQFYRVKKHNRAFLPIPLKVKLSQEEVARFASQQYRFPGVYIKARLMRYYPFKESMAHILGYVGRINLQELQQADPTHYQATNFIGKSGIEKFYEKPLHGEIGYQLIETDVSGRTVRILSQQNPTAGEKLYLTLDARLQAATHEALINKRGAIVAIQPQDGSILALSSSPSFDPNLFVEGISTQDYQTLALDPARPLYNRAVRGLYPPASTIKPFVALAALEKGVIDLQHSIYDPGWFKLPGASHLYRDWKKHGHGMVHLKRAITVSCDTYFYQLSNKMGILSIEDMLKKFGFGTLTHIDLYEEANGLVPNPNWKKKAKSLPWYPGDTVITSIGQGFTLVSPLQLANATASLSQQGHRFRPHLLLRSISADQQEKPYPILEEYPFHLKEKSHWASIADAMHSVITSQEGTGYRFGRNAPYTVAAKTGTAQVFGGKHYEKSRNIAYEKIPEYLRDHSLFIAFAPVENPEIALAVIVENEYTASNVARKVLDTYFHLKEEQQLKEAQLNQEQVSDEKNT